MPIPARSPSPDRGGSGKPGSPEVLSGQRQPWRTAAEIIDWSIPCPSIFDRKKPLKDATNHRLATGVMRYVVTAAEPFIVPITHSGPPRVHSMGEPLRTTTTAKRGEFAVADAELVAVCLDRQFGTSRGTPVTKPVGTAMAGSPKTALVGATLIQTSYGERPGQSPRVPHLTKPLGAAVAGGVKHAAVTAFLSKFASGNAPTGAAEPLQTSETRAKQAVVCAHMEQANTGMVGHAATKPVSTIVGRGTTQRLVETTLIEADALPPEMLDRAVKVAAFLIKYYGSAQHGQTLDEPLHSATSKARFAVVTVTIDATTYVLIDIGMRMLTPRELARAQGFPDSYVLDPIGPNGKPLSKTAQIRMIGNSVCPQMAEALVRANLGGAYQERLAA